MFKTLMKGIELNRAEKLMKNINDAIRKELMSSVHWSCFIKKSSTSLSLVIEYKSYENWKEEDLAFILKLIQAKCTKHNLVMYFHNFEYTLQISVDIKG